MQIPTLKVSAVYNNEVAQLASLQPEGWGEIVTPHTFYTQSTFCFPLKIAEGDEIVGIGTAIIHEDVAWLGHIIVHPQHRNKGIGKLITQTLIDLPIVKRCETVYLIATELGAPVYTKCGFETETEYLYFKDVKAKPEWTISSSIIPYRDEFREQITAMDRLISTENRLQHIDAHFQESYVYLRENIVEGYYLPGLGEGLIVSTNEEAGLELIKYRLQSGEKLAFPKDNIAATNFMYSNGYRESSSGKRMRLGKKRNVQLANIYNRIGGNVG
ncbi:MAG TPA: GNAT family N-acetyltransferase [Chitinophagaceae bacterium]|jgi:GNAT superfamily N-acetyltransferase|nr:GNAT family N-acetyltransferase [Chitinophagaceae bacterium]